MSTKLGADPSNVYHELAATHVRMSEFVPLLDGACEPTAVDPRLAALAELRLLVESRLGDAAWSTIVAPRV